MKTFFKKLLVTLAVIFSVTATASFTTPAPVYAADNDLGSCRMLLGLTSWDCGIDPNVNDEETLTTNVILIASNVLTDLGVIAAYLAIGFVIYGGYLYIFSGGDAGKVASGKKTLIHAFIGLAVVMLSNVVLNSIRIAFLGTSGSFGQNCGAAGVTCVEPSVFVANVLNWFIGCAGAIALIYVFIGGFGYLTSAGDSGKLQKSKSTIVYALIGLAIVALSLGIVAFVRGIIENADTPTSSMQTTIIAKE